MLLFPQEVSPKTQALPLLHRKHRLFASGLSAKSYPEYLYFQSVNHGSVYIYDRKEALLAIGVSAYTKEYDEFGKTTGQSFYYRQVTSDQDLAYICCLLNENAVRTVFSLTWVNATYDQGKPVSCRVMMGIMLMMMLLMLMIMIMMINILIKR